MKILFHYIKIAIRNMRKFKRQTLTSIIGMSVGLTCFAMAVMWIRYEMTFDSFHKSSKQMYVVYTPNSHSQTGYDRINSYLLGAHLKKTFPEIANTTHVFASALYAGKIIVDGVEIPSLTIQADSSFFRMFDIKILEGSWDFLIPDNNKVAITREKAFQLFGNQHPIGKTITAMSRELTICAIVTGMSKRSNYAFDLISTFSYQEMNDWFSWLGNTIIELFPETNIETFEKKLHKHVIDANGFIIKDMKIKPITKLRYTDPDVEREVPFQHILIFFLLGFLVILCSLFNFITLFVSRYRMRQKELALRMVCGASKGSLLAMLLVEVLLTLLFAVLLGCALMQIFCKPFLMLSDIQMALPAIYKELLMYIGSIILLLFVLFRSILLILMRTTINFAIRQSNKNMFRKISVAVQLVISIGIVFCTVIILKQVYFLHHTTEIGFSFHNQGLISMKQEEVDSSILGNYLKQIPEIKEFVYGRGMRSLIPEKGIRTSQSINSWDDKPDDAKEISIEKILVSHEYFTFYDFQLVMGEMLTDADSESMVLLNESAVKAFGWYTPIGKQFFDNKYKVKGVIKNVYNLSPTRPANPCFYINPQGHGHNPIIPSFLFNREAINIQFKYSDGMWKSCKDKIERMFQQGFEGSELAIYNSEEEYDKNFKSEKNLIKLLSFVSIICVLICMFGFVSLVSLTCEERRKSIAIRKINGATVGNILIMFSKEYFLLLSIGGGCAFTTGHIIMQRWLEHYVKQTSVPAWIYLAILFIMAFVIALCVGWQVYRTSIENPAEVMKNE